MLNNTFSDNSSSYEGQLIEGNQNLKDLVEELLRFINRNNLDFDNEDEIERLLIKTGI